MFEIRETFPQVRQVGHWLNSSSYERVDLIVSVSPWVIPLSSGFPIQSSDRWCSILKRAVVRFHRNDCIDDFLQSSIFGVCVHTQLVFSRNDVCPTFISSVLLIHWGPSRTLEVPYLALMTGWLGTFRFQHIAAICWAFEIFDQVATLEIS